MSKFHSLFVTTFVPDPNGHGAAQRAMSHLTALASLGPVDMIVIYRPGDRDVETASLKPSAKLTSHATKLALEGWNDPWTHSRWIPYKLGTVLDAFQIGCTEAPTLPSSSWNRLAATLPSKSYDLAYAFRLPAAHAVDVLIERRNVTAQKRIADFDDILSRYSQRWLDTEKERVGRLRAFLMMRNVNKIANRELRVLQEWDGVSVCSCADVQALYDRCPTANLTSIPNSVDHSRLAPASNEAPRLLFVGSLTSPANIHGIKEFVSEAWPIIRARVPGVHLEVVGLLPSRDMVHFLSQDGIHLVANAPRVQPHYKTADIVICPIRFGSGTRIKLLEAMAFCRAIVSTSLGAEGLDVKSGRDMLIADRMDEFAQAVVSLCHDSMLRGRIAASGNMRQQALYSPDASRRALFRQLQRANLLDNSDTPEVVIG